MRAVQLTGAVALIGFAMVSAQEGGRPQPMKIEAVAAKARDRDVLQALLLSLLGDKEFPNAPLEPKRKIVLHLRTPPTTELILNPSLVRADTKNTSLPKQAWDDLVHRNRIRGRDDSVHFSFREQPFDPRVLVDNVYRGSDLRLGRDQFRDEYPDARGWISAWAPGFTKDGKIAVVRARFGPPPQAGTVTAILRQEGGRWVLVWRRFALYR